MAELAWCKKEKVKTKTWIIGLLLTLLYKFLEISSNFVYWFIYRNAEPKKLPPIDTSEEVVKSFINRIKAVNPTINCVVDERYELAIEEAKNVDKLIQSGVKDQSTLELETPFLGVPFTIKDCFSVTGLRYTAGLVKRKDIIGKFDADVVAAMKKAGAILLAVTNVSELCMWWESSNNVYGRSRNAYDTNRIVGGSSGGEAALLSAAGSPFGIGSDIGGSIRMPAFFNGIFGHKPTRGIVSNFEQQPVAGDVLQTFLTTGPMSRFCADLLPMYRILAADNIGKLKLDTKVNVSKLRFFYLEDFGKVPLLSPIHPDVKDAQWKAIRHIQQAYNIPVQKVQLSKLYHAFEMWSVKMSTGGNATFCAELAMKKGEISVIKELFKCCIGQSEYTFPALALGMFEKLSLPASHPTSRKMIAMCDELLRELQELLGDDGVLLVPPHPTPALYHTQPLTKPFNAAYTAVFNVLGLPVTQVPLGLGSWGVPVGVQVVSNLYNDHLSLAVAAELERAFGGWVSPSVVTC